MLLLLPAVASAHVPHDTALALVAPADATAREPWFLLLDPQGLFLWLRSDDAGRTWTMTAAEPLEDNLLGAARTDDGGIALLGEDRLWWSTDWGASWSASALPGAVDQLAPRGHELVLAGPSGLYTGRPDTTWTRALKAPIQLLGPDAAWSTSAGGFVDRDGWTAAGPIADGVVTAVDDDGVELWLGLDTGDVLHGAAGAWSTCGALPTKGGDHDNVVRIAHDSDRILVATGTGGPYVSEDDCLTWTSADNGIPVDYGSGGAGTDAAAFTFLDVLGGTWAIGGWAGLQLSRDQGGTWTNPPLIPPDYARGLSFEEGWPGGRRLFVGGYAAGVQYSDDGGVTWAAPDHGLTTTNVQKVRTDPGDPDVLYAIVDHIGWVSRDLGQSWVRFGPDEATNVESVYAWGAAEQHVWLTSDQLFETLDGGASWTERTDLEDTFGGGHVTGVMRFAMGVCVTTAEPASIACSHDDGVTWDVSTDSAEGRTSGLAAWPAHGPKELVWGDADGIHLYSLLDGSGQFVVTPPIEQVVVVEDDRLFAITRGGQLLRSEDGGLGWDAVGDRLPAHVHALRPRPDWMSHPELVAATHDGTYVGTADGEWRRLDYERIDDASAMLACAGCTAPEVVDGASCDSVTGVPGGAVASAWMRGTHLTVLGDGEGAELAVDGVSKGPVSDVDGRLVEVDGLPDGWHEVTLTGLPGSTVRVDALEAWADSTPLTLSIEPTATWSGEAEVGVRDEGGVLRDTGCGSHHSEAWVLVGLVPWARRRRLQRGSTSSGATTPSKRWWV